MSSPPPHPTPTNPLKRPSLSSSASQPLGSNPKRPRMHPLRQTSFPASIDNDQRAFSATSDAGSVTGSFTGSLGGTSADGVFLGAAKKGKRGRKSKAEKEREREQREDAASLRGDTRLGSVDADGMSVRAGGTARGDAAGEEGDEDEDFDDEGELLRGEEGVTDTEAEKKNLALLVDAFNPIQSERYDLFKRAKLRKETLRRIVNHALSQSVPASVVTTINGFTKVFAGEIIEKARTVQAEWAIAHDQAARAAFDAEEAEAEARAAEAAAREGQGQSQPQTSVKKEHSDSNRSTPIPPSSSSPMPQQQASQPSTPSVSGPPQQQQQEQQPPPARPKREFKPPPNPHRGQLLPSHLREALRRYKRDGEGGGVGFSGLTSSPSQTRRATASLGLDLERKSKDIVVQAATATDKTNSLRAVDLVVLACLLIKVDLHLTDEHSEHIHDSEEDDDLGGRVEEEDQAGVLGHGGLESD
ncbi:hypothetical protein KXV53_005946 [Aspergillus fumigatus]|nr:hypothetical protein KXX51_007774 [Aspergillus fumigatus]KAH1601768.1 hypothetical protein KXX34_002928 [Aspergillus fumigatus]KAH1629479.1 hypothetical protein KXX39_003824 [Aspergillus fumigatus]KAH1681985.1 hypothetical protein KXX46_004877 [Aspergillus fumigatus]KAH1884934.1 hypothetical protein KXX01_001325 [Aspergillus fumigatus]